MNVFNAVGRVGKDAEVRFTPAGDAIAGWSLAVTHGYGKSEGTTWLNCSLFGKRGEALAQYITKGSQVAITGEILLNTYKGKDGTEKSSLECRVNNVTLLGSKAEAKPTLKLVENDRDLSDLESDVPF